LEGGDEEIEISALIDVKERGRGRVEKGEDKVMKREIKALINVKGKRRGENKR